MRRTLAVVLLVLALGACQQDERFLPAGEFSGSTANKQRVDLLLSAEKPKVNGQKASWYGRGEIRLEEVPGKPILKCIVRFKGEELQCQWPQPGGGYETVELVRV